MFLIPSHIRQTLYACLTDSPRDGPHTALILLPQGHVLCTASTSDADWAPSSSTGDQVEAQDENLNGVESLDFNGDDEDAEGDEEEEEPYMASPARNRLLRGVAKSEWAAKVNEARQDAYYAEDGEVGVEEVKVECELGRLLLVPIHIPTYTLPEPTLNSNFDPSGFRTPNNFGYQPSTRTQGHGPGRGDVTDGAVEEGALGEGERERGRTMLLVLNGVKSVRWERLQEKAKVFKANFRSRATWPE